VSLHDLPELAAGPAGPSLGLYVHCLFCRTRCPYCDFNVAIYREDRIAPLLLALREELSRYAALPWAGTVPAVSLFFGGGTPSLLPPEGIGDLVAQARRDLALTPDAEVTLEANPEGLDRERLTAFRHAGVNRLSLGIQALDDDLLGRLGREHSAENARRAFAAARAAGFANIGIDLLYGCPGQSEDAWAATLDEALAWGPEHLSAYALTLEPGTAFGRRAPAGLPSDDTQVAQFGQLAARAARAGLERYEISNFARPGFRSRHNLLYWRRADYVGLGPGAHSALGRLRLANLRSRSRYAAALEAGHWPIERWERLRDDQVEGERLVLGLRLVEGVPRAWLEARLESPGRASRILRDYLDAGLLELRDDRIALTSPGVLVSDAIFAELV
jgi:oxygen-independent coproporphyrinogen-3 oxidase